MVSDAGTCPVPNAAPSAVEGRPLQGGQDRQLGPSAAPRAAWTLLTRTGQGAGHFLLPDFARRTIEPTHGLQMVSLTAEKKNFPDLRSDF